MELRGELAQHSVWADRPRGGAGECLGIYLVVQILHLVVYHCVVSLLELVSAVASQLTVVAENIIVACA